MHPLSAQADGTFTDTKLLLPVDCGKAPDRKNSDHPDKAHIHIYIYIYIYIHMYKSIHT